MRDYYSILGLRKGASESEIKKAYRAKAKQYHPDRNKHPRAAEAFVLVNEAYEMLLNPSFQSASIAEDLEKRKKYYGSSKAGEMKSEERREAARARARNNAQKSYESFVQSPIYKTAMVVSRILDFAAILFSMVLIIAPFLVFALIPIDERQESGVYGMFSLSIIGSILLYGYWKFMFIKQDED